MPIAHRGEAVKQVLEERSINKAKLADKLGKDYKTLWRWLQDPELSYDRIKLIGDTIDYDFSKTLPEMPVPRNYTSLEDPEVVYGSLAGKTAAEVTGLYYALLKRYNDLNQRYGDALADLHIYMNKYGPLKK